MTNIVDIKLAKDENGEYDIVLTPDGDIESINSFETAILMSIQCERRADESEVESPQKRRGWWGNDVYQESDTFEMGSKIWIHSQARLTQNVINSIADYGNESLQWLIELVFAQKVESSAEVVDNRAIINIKVVRFNIQESYSFPLWENTRRIG